MCGVAGILGGSKSAEQELNGMMDSIAHRGPDASGVYISPSEKVFLGSQRLSILDLSENGKMPMSSSDGSVVVCQNGEIYNYIDLKDELEAKGYKFMSESDTEVIVYGYIEWGSDVFSKLRGMFVISLYDKKNDLVFLARDRLGIKPLYYLNYKDSVYFASEAKAFAEVGYFLGDNIDVESVHKLLGFMFFPESSTTIIKGVNKLPPGTYAQINPNKLEVTINKYWELPSGMDQNDISFSSAVEQLDTLLRETVKMHLQSDVPLGIMLSGGLDSSLLAAYVKELSDGERVATFNARFNHKFDESKYAKKVAKHLDTDHKEILIDTSRVNANMEEHIRSYDDLTTFDGGLITTKILCNEIKKSGITVLLLGEGADELFGGYSWFGLSQLPFSFLPRFVQASMYYYAISRNITFNSKFYYGFWNQIYSSQENTDVFRQISNTELNVQLPNHLLMKVDKGSMQASVEARVPYLDHKVVEYVYNLPREFKLRGSVFNMNSANEKYILREVGRKYLPKDIFTRKKRGFMIPMLDVLNADIKKVKDYVFASDSISQRLFTISTLAELFEFRGPNLIDMQKEYLLWRLFLLEIWKKEYAKTKI